MKKHLLALSLLSSLTLPVCAQGFYVFGDYERNKMEVDIEEFSLSKTKNGYGLGLGYKINQTFALELAYRDLIELKNSFTYEDYEASSEVDVTALQASVVANYALNDQFGLFGRLGVGQIKIKANSYENEWGTITRESESESKTRALVGLGISYNFSEKLAARAEYSRFAEVDDVIFSALSLALVYDF